MPRSLYLLERTLQERFSLRPAQCPTFALWVYGTVLAGSGCQNSVIAALLALGNFAALRQRLRDWLKDGPDKAAPCDAQIDVTTCFAPLLAWAVRFAGTQRAVFALDATAQRDELTALCVSPLFRVSALPVAWHLLVGNQKERWKPHWERLLKRLTAALPPGKRPLLLEDRGLWSPALFAQARAAGFIALFRVQNTLRFAPQGQEMLLARTLVPAPGCAWVGRGQAYGYRLPATLMAVWLVGQDEPCLCLSDAAAGEIEVDAYGLRMWIEAGFRNLKRFGWQWQNTRRTDPARAMRHWLVLAVATLYTFDEGAHQEDREPPLKGLRLLSVFRRGLKALQQRWAKGRWRQIVVTAGALSALVYFTASGANVAPAQTELLLQKLPSVRRAPTDKYISQGFFAFAVGGLSQGFTVESGIYVPAYRFVNPLTGQMTDLRPLPEISIL